MVCPSLDSNRSLQYLVSTPQGRLLEQAITATLLKIARQLQQAYPDDIDASAVERVNSIYSFDQELVIDRLGFANGGRLLHRQQPPALFARPGCAGADALRRR